MVEERKWLTPADFAETIGLCQFLPGPNIGNASIVLGKRWFGLSGAVVAFLGLFALPFVWVLALGALYMDFASNPMVRGTVTGIGVAGGGLFIGTAVKLGKALVKKPAALVLVLACFLSLGRCSTSSRSPSRSRSSQRGAVGCNPARARVLLRHPVPGVVRRHPVGDE
jgi:chromate transporter